MKFLLSTFLLFLVFANAMEAKPKTINWLNNYDKAIAQAKAEKKPVLLFFHGSDWCPPCMKMQKEVFANDEFIGFTDNKIVFLDVDFPYKNKLSADQLAHNNGLKKKYGLPEDFGQGYPQVVIVNPDEKVVYQEMGYNGEGPKKLMNEIGKITK